MKYRDVEVGDVVELNSGSPALTVVEKYEDTEKIRVEWSIAGCRETGIMVLPAVCFRKTRARKGAKR
jgi:hypothetical protein